MSELDDNDWIEILFFLRDRLKAANLKEFDEKIMTDFNARGGRENFEKYLSMLIQTLTQRSKQGYQETIKSLQGNIEGKIEGIEVAINPHDQGLFGTDIIELQNLRDYRPLLNDIKILRDTLINNKVIND